MNRNVVTEEEKPDRSSVPEQTGRLIDRARNAYWMAPMSGITDVCFRQLMDEMGAGVLVSELVSAKGLVFNSERTRRMIEIHKNPGTLVGIQLSLPLLKVILMFRARRLLAWILPPHPTSQ